MNGRLPAVSIHDAAAYRWLMLASLPLPARQRGFDFGITAPLCQGMPGQALGQKQAHGEQHQGAAMAARGLGTFETRKNASGIDVTHGNTSLLDPHASKRRSRRHIHQGSEYIWTHHDCAIDTIMNLC